jgi:hypothetical protein
VNGSPTARYDAAQRAYVIERVAGESDARVELAASPEHPLVNPALVVPNWSGTARATVEGAALTAGEQAQLGYIEELEGRTLVVYLPLTATSPVIVTLTREK